MFLCILAGAFLANCSAKPSSVSGGSGDGGNGQLDLCSSTKIENQFIVHWTDGRITVEHAVDEDEFFENVVLENEDLIQDVENNHRVTLLPPVRLPSEKATASAAAVNWGIDKIEAETVWSHADGSGVIVAVIDSGADLTHPQLANQLYVNTAEKNGTAGVDDDGNGFVDDINGYDFAFETGNVTEVLVADSHGTHVSGIIAAEHIGSDNVKGVAPGAKILPLNFMDASAAGTLADAIRAIDYAVSQGAKVINASWGSGSCSTILEQKIASLGSAGVLFVAAAGNSGADISVYPEFPAAYSFSHQLTVGASTINDIRAGFSNRSSSLVQLLAPGLDIISTVPSDDTSESKDGTSMATPFVSGAAAVLFSSNPNATPSQVRDALIQSVDGNPNIEEGDAASRGRLNLRSAYNLLNGTNI